MVKKKKARKSKKAKKTVKKPIKKTARKKKVPAATIVGTVEHYFGKISVIAFKVKHPIKVGDTLRFKGHTTDFTQRIDSIQIQHQNVPGARKGDDIGIKVKDKVRVGDLITLEPEPERSSSAPPTGASSPPPKKSDPYSNTKFFKF